MNYGARLELNHWHDADDMHIKRRGLLLEEAKETIAWYGARTGVSGDLVQFEVGCFVFLSLWTVIQVKQQHWYEPKKMERVCKNHSQSNNQPYWKRIGGAVGPRQGLDLNESGQGKSELAWKNIPTRQQDHILGIKGSHIGQSSIAICSTLRP